MAWLFWMFSDMHDASSHLFQRGTCYLSISLDQAAGMYRLNFPWKCNVLLKINENQGVRHRFCLAIIPMEVQL